MFVKIYNDDCLERLKSFDSDSVDAVVTDPPYGLSQMSADKVTQTLVKWGNGERSFVPAGKGFMNVSWDNFVPPPALWDEVYRILKPGGHLLSFASSRTFDIMNLSIRLANFEIRDSIQWLYGSGLPKSMNVSKAVESEVLYGSSHTSFLRKTEQKGDGESYTLKGTNNGILGEKRVYERKTYSPSTDEGKKWDGWGTALKPAFEPITVARKPLAESSVARNVLEYSTGALNIDDTRFGEEKKWATNVILDESQAERLNEQSPNAARFFYIPKPSKKEKPSVDGITHETVKPILLMRELVKLVTPVDGVVLDPFAGSGTTLEAAALEGFSAYGIEREEKYIQLIEHRLNNSDIVVPFDII